MAEPRADSASPLPQSSERDAGASNDAVDRELKRLRAELQRTKLELQISQSEAKRLQQRPFGTSIEISEHFLASITHDLRTPLSAILLWTSLIEDERTIERGHLNQALTAIKDSAEELSALVEKLANEARTIASKIKAESNSRSPLGRARDGAASNLTEPAAPLGRCHVLLIEDMEGTRQQLTTVLENVGATVDAVDSAAAAWEALDRQKPDVIVSDLTLPTIDAFDFIRQLRESEEGNPTTRVPALGLTKANDAEMMREALRNGFQSCVPKPVEPLQLISAIAKLFTPNSPETQG